MEAVKAPVAEPVKTSAAEPTKESVSGGVETPKVEDLKIPATENTKESASGGVQTPKVEPIKTPAAGTDKAPVSGAYEIKDYKQQNLFEERLITPEKRKDFRIIGQVFETYWLLQVDRKLLIVDQHAAHEKVLYERTMKRMREENIPAQQLAPPIILTLTPMEIDVVTRYQDTFLRMGFTIEPFGGREYAVYSVPDHLFGAADEELLREMIDELTENTGKAGIDQISDRIATASCKAAIKGNDEISIEEAEKLLDELFTLENPYTCPHGRPTIISMSEYELEKKFRRIV
jgi:DNA mismatch repair protein MutL